MIDTKPRVRVKAGTTAFPAAAPKPRGALVQRATARWLRDTSSGALNSRFAGLVDSRHDIAWVWDRVSALAVDFIQNSARLKGAVDQVMADTVGTELKLNAKPDLALLGYTPKQAMKLKRLIEKRFREWSWNPSECDLRGKLTLPQMTDIVLRYHIAFGESTGVMDYLAPAARRRYGITTGLKVCLISPHRLVRETMEFEGLYSGVVHDENGRPVAYRFQERKDGIEVKTDYPARDADGRQVVIHLFDAIDAADVRGISVIASAMKTHASAERLHDATLATAILQQIYAAVLTSPEPSAEAFQALEALETYADPDGDPDNTVGHQIYDYFASTLDRARESSIYVDGTSQVSHLAPGEKLEFKTPSTPGSNYIPFKADLDREMARCIGITYAAYSMNHEGATYSSVRMENASIWPVVMRRRERIAAPFCQAVYENWLDEEIGEGRIKIRGGYEAFKKYRNELCWAEWQGPAKPTADDHKSARAATERLQNGTTTLAYECAEFGLDVNDVIAQRAEEAKQLADAGLPNVFLPKGQSNEADDEAEPERRRGTTS